MGKFDFPTLRKQYLNIVRTKGYFLSDRYLNVESMVLELERMMQLGSEKLVPCNND